MNGSVYFLNLTTSKRVELGPVELSSLTLIDLDDISLLTPSVNKVRAKMDSMVLLENIGDDKEVVYVCPKKNMTIKLPACKVLVEDVEVVKMTAVGKSRSWTLMLIVKTCPRLVTLVATTGMIPLTGKSNGGKTVVAENATSLQIFWQMTLLRVIIVPCTLHTTNIQKKAKQSE
jgi:hypothetical protein